MFATRRYLAWLACGAWLMGAPQLLAAQEPPADAPAAPTIELPDDPLVRALMETKPREPHEIVEAALALDDLGAPQVGKGLLAQFLATNPTPEVLAELADRFGSAALLRLARVEKLQPEGQQLSDAALGAAHQRDNDPQWIATQIERLSQGTPRQKAAARVALRRGGAAAAAALIAALADPNRQAEAAALRGALVAGDERFVPPLVATLEADDPALRATALAILAALEGFDAPQALDHLIAFGDSALAVSAGKLARDRFGRDPQAAATAGRLRRAAEDLLAGRTALATDADGTVSLWGWDEKSKAPIATPMSAPEAARHLALLHLKRALALVPENTDLRRLRASLLLSQATTDPPSDPLLAEVNELSVGDVEAVLESAMEAGEVASACGAARRLGEIGSADELLFSRAPSPAPLVTALKSPHPLVRSAALASVLHLEPQRVFPGGSYVADTLDYFAHARGTPRALVAHRSVAEGQRLAGLLAQLGYEPEVVADAAALARGAARSPDVALVVLDVAFLYPSAEAACDMLRVDPTTSLLPILLVSTPATHERAVRLARRDPQSYALISPLDVEQMRSQLARIHPELAQPAVHKEALQLAQQAVESIGQRLTSEPKPNEPALLATLVESLREPQLAASAAGSLAKLPSREAQLGLAAAAAQTGLPSAARQAMAEAFAANVAAGGVRLTPDEVLAQYEVYNQARRDDDTTRVVMGLVLDAMELSGAYAAEDAGPAPSEAPEG